MHTIEVSLVFAMPEKQWLYESTVDRGTSAQELICASGFLGLVPSLSGFNVGSLDIGVFAQRIDVDYLLQAGDRVEIYRPLTADPKQVRRQLATMGKTMGKASSK